MVPSLLPCLLLLGLLLLGASSAPDYGSGSIVQEGQANLLLSFSIDLLFTNTVLGSSNEDLLDLVYV